MDIDDVLESAAKLIETPGFWTQHAMARNRYGRPIAGTLRLNEEKKLVAGVPVPERVASVCAVGAVETAAAGLFGTDHAAIREDAIKSLADTVYPFIRADRTDLTMWNDKPSRTADEVAEKLREAAANWRIAQEQES